MSTPASRYHSFWFYFSFVLTTLNCCLVFMSEGPIKFLFLGNAVLLLLGTLTHNWLGRRCTAKTPCPSHAGNPDSFKPSKP